MKVGIIAPYWLPKFGGGEQYIYRLTKSLLEKGVDIQIFTGTPFEEGADNGDCEQVVTRWHPYGQVYGKVWGRYFEEIEKERWTQSEEHIFNEYEFYTAAVEWAIEKDLEIVMINNPLTRAMHFQARELYQQLKQQGMKVGSIHHDLGLSIRHDLVEQYTGENFGDWEGAAEAVGQIWKDNLTNSQGSHLQCYYHMDSPLFFEPDFVISNSEWSERFIDPLEQVPKLVVHPLMDAEKWTENVAQPEGLEHKDILMINPHYHKGRSIMANLIFGADEDWTFRVLKGGYGDAFREFVPMVGNSRAAESERIEFNEYVYDIREAYRNSSLVFFPSRYEGYGMAAVEPMFCGIPVVSSSYPPILEAVGDAAKVVCPFTSSPDAWYDAVDDVILQPELWVGKGLERAKILKDRQEREVWELIYFLGALL
jgi:glycosyltransferase involved in cell wall biosynthesis